IHVAFVKAHGVAAANKYSQKFDGCVPASLRVPAEVIEQSLETLEPKVLDALKEAIRRVRAFHEAQRPEDQDVEIAEGGVVSERWIPVERVGLYVPGGKAVYPSSVIMNAVPAQAAGVGSRVVAPPTQEEGGGWARRRSAARR